MSTNTFRSAAPQFLEPLSPSLSSGSSASRNCSSRHPPRKPPPPSDYLEILPGAHALKRTRATRATTQMGQNKERPFPSPRECRSSCIACRHSIVVNSYINYYQIRSTKPARAASKVTAGACVAHLRKSKQIFENSTLSAFRFLSWILFARTICNNRFFLFQALNRWPRKCLKNICRLTVELCKIFPIIVLP